MALIACYVIAYVQILSAGFNLWGVDPATLVNVPFGRNTIFIGLFLVAHLLGLAGAILVLQKMRLGLVLSIAHHILLVPALVVTSWGLVMLMDDRVNATLLFMSKPNGSDVAFYWSLGWGTVFDQATRNVPTGSTYIGINLFALGCAAVMWTVMKQADAATAEHEREMRRRRKQQARPRLPPPERAPQQSPPPQRAPQPNPQQHPHPQQRMYPPQQDARQRPRPRIPPRGY